MVHKISIFISHAWSKSEHYEKLAEWIFDGDWKVGNESILFTDYSVPKDDPIHHATNANSLKNAIFQRIIQSHVIVIPTGMYASYRHWIQKEIDGAIEYRRPILAVNPWGQERKSSVVIEAANKLVGWNKDAVVKAVWELYRDNYS